LLFWFFAWARVVIARCLASNVVSRTCDIIVNAMIIIRGLLRCALYDLHLAAVAGVLCQ
jgi:hypothetical protein